MPADGSDEFQLTNSSNKPKPMTTPVNGTIKHQQTNIAIPTHQPLPPHASTNGVSLAASVNLKASQQQQQRQSDLRLHFSNVNYVHKQCKSITTQILNDACGEFKSGRLTAILGPSGAGKTSLLNALSGFKASGVTGNIELNGKPRNIVEFRRMSSYIPQNFAMLDLLTVQETLRVSTDLKLPAETTIKEKDKIISNILEMLNLTHSRNTLVQNLSGGEYKRLSIGVEMVTNPPIMFFDEPTSGLDSVASYQIISYLHKLARDGRVIACVVHQPSSRLMKLFDDILVVSNGCILYSGPQEGMLAEFQKSGFECPQYYNPADYVLEVSSDFTNPLLSKLIHDNRMKHNSGFKTANNNGNAESAALLTNPLSKASTPPHTTVDMLSTISLETEGIRPKERVSVWRQFMVLLKRSTTSTYRNMLSVRLRIIMHIAVAILLGIVFWQIGNDGAKTLTNASCIFFVVMFVFFGNAMPSIFLCPQECAVFIREYLNGWYSIKSYYLAKIISDLPLQFVCPTLLTCIAYFMTGQPMELGRGVMFWGMCLLTGMIGHFMGLVCGSLFQMQMGVFLVPCLTIPLLIFSGFFIRIFEVAAYLKILCDISFFRYTIEGLLRSLYAYDRPDLECSLEFCYYRHPKKFLKDFGMFGDLYGQDVMALCIWILALMILFLFSLWLRIKKAL
ncbi:ATP-binding cassette sub-family G member 4 isoform X1 [Musca domestica]|uniref:ABC-2 type transporter n=1 Tax=Musca domestica TaxID=7370 RepID=T1PC81_MUSDO|nr:ATP-binding cassette sub-family G member 4 isoform X1 [Musca domestica]XP_005179749.1 ATP-binding cassette sub-family G member 4 isoform X1 [Musca domestica]XP_005179750.1 ATP-binding cassette sub-family G member 4 isoform X1 [Musca domestica]XP_005179751.1 ATP-binding cassette sub-family G member 4 isoform X1 [Musca domestica]XP_019891000.1 ATP-binding cassette sub-family G member 4 isoform X1 [Musca domestica]XP_019891001.1 ATP-binding cassette sub-family G member 4 isoform X1 [Musca dome